MFLFKLFILLSNIYAGEIILITHDNSKQSIIVREILEKTYSIPSSLIKERNIQNPCTTREEAIVHLCINNRKELKIIKVNKKVLRNSLQIFSRP
jgi:uncharacterized protein YcaQ